MRSGKLRYPAELVREVTDRTESGADTTVSKTILKTRVGITTVTGREFIEGGAETMEVSNKIVMRKPSGIEVLLGDEILANNKKYEVIFPLEFDNGRSLNIMCKEIV
jgi:head-tail adaptor